MLKFKNKLGIIKRQIRQIVSIMLVISLSIPAVTFAAGEESTYTYYADEAQYDGLNSTAAETGAYDGSHGRMHLQPSLQGKIIFTVNVAEAGEYTLDIVYTCGSAVNRKLGYSVNGGTTTYTGFLDKTGTWSITKNVTAAVTLKAGDNTIAVLSPTDYGKKVDAKTVGTPDIFAIKVSDTEKAVSLTKYADEAQYDGLNSTTAEAGTYEGSHGRVHLQPSLQSKIMFTANVKEAGEYTLDIVYTCGSAVNRKLGYSVNGGDPTYTEFLDKTGTWSTTKNVTAMVTLEAGDNTITLLSPSDYGETVDTKKVGTPDIFAVKLAPVPPAVTEGTLYADEAEYEGLKSTVADRTTLYDTTHGRIHLQPLELQGKIIFTVNVAEAGEYTLGIVYSGRGIVRKLGYSVNSGDVIYSDALEATQYWSAETAKTYKVNVTLNEGKNIITVLSPADYDGTTVGTPDIWAVKFAPAPSVTLKEMDGERLSALKEALTGKNISIMGDSISTYDGYSNDAANTNSSIGNNAIYYTSARLKDVNDTWWMQTASDTGMNVLVNNSWSGSKVFANAASAGYKNRAVNLHDNTGDNAGTTPDVIAIYLGINDCIGKSEAGTYSDGFLNRLVTDNRDGTFAYAEPTNVAEAYFIMLHKITTTYPKADVFCMTLMENSRITDENAASALAQYNANIKAIANYFDMNVVDWNSESGITLGNYFIYTLDGLHPNDYGMDMMTIALEEALYQKYVVETPAPPVTPPQAVTEGTLYADEAQYEGLNSTESKTETFYDTTHGRVSLAPKKNGDSYDAGKMIFTVNIGKAGSYVLYFVYSAGAPTRKLGYSINDGAVKYVTLDKTSTWKASHAKEYKVKVDLKQGINKITLCSPSDYEPKVVQAPDIWAVKYAPESTSGSNKPTSTTVRDVMAGTSSKSTSEEAIRLYAGEAETKNLYFDGEVTLNGLLDNAYGYISTKPAYAANDGQIIFTIVAEKEGTYNLDILYTAKKGVTRKLGYSLNNSEVLYVMVGEYGENWSVAQIKYLNIQVPLKAGENTFTIWSPYDYTEGGVQAPNIYAIQYSFENSKMIDLSEGLKEVLPEGYFAVYADNATYSNLNDTDAEYESTYEGTHGRVHLVPEKNEDGTYKQGSIIFKVNAEMTGTYEIDIIYSGKGVTRKIEHSVNKGAKVSAELKDSATWDAAKAKSYTFEAELKAGENTIIVYSPSDYEAGVVQAPDIWAVKGALKK